MQAKHTLCTALKADKKIGIVPLPSSKSPIALAFVAFACFGAVLNVENSYAQNVITLEAELLKASENGVETQSELERVFPQSVADIAEAEAAAANEQNSGLGASLGGVLGTDQPASLLRPGVGLPTPDQRPITERALRQSQVVEQAEDGSIDTRSNLRTGAIQAGVGRREADNPFAAQGFRLGTWNANASLEQGFSSQSNIDNTEKAKSGFDYISTLIFSAVSNWSRHSATVDVRLENTGEFDSDTDDTQSATIGLGLALDLAGDLRGTGNFEYSYGEDTQATAPAYTSVVKQPDLQVVKADIGIAQTNRRLFMSLRGGIENSKYGNATFGTGGVLEQDFRDNTYFTTTGRISYESKPANIYYLEAALGHRVHESKFDSTNGKRDATTYNLTVGSEFELSEKVNGNYSIGYQIDDYEDSSLKSLDGLTLNGGINWSPQREVNVSVNAQTSFTEAANSTTPGSIVRSIDGTITRQATQRLQLNATGGVRLTYDDKNNLDSSVWNVGSGFEYAINKHMSFKGSVDYEEQTNEETSVSIDNTTFSTSLKLQR